MPVPAPEVFSIQPMLSAFSQGRAAKVALEDRQRQMEREAEDAIYRAAELADTPEKWSRFIDTIGQQFPDADISEYRDFSSRETAMGMSMTPYERAQLDLARRDQAMQERAFAAQQAAANAPRPMLTDETVNGVLGQRNPQTGEFSPYPEWMQNGGEPEPNFSDENSLRNHFDQITGNYRVVGDAYRQIEAAAAGDTGASDMALIFSYMKMLDPGSTVREGEYATAQQTTNIPGYVANLYNQAVDGTKLNEEQRSQFVTAAASIYSASQSQYTNLQNQYRDLATSYGMDPNRVVIAGQPGQGGVAVDLRRDANAPPAGFVTAQPTPASAPVAYGVTPAPAGGQPPATAAPAPANLPPLTRDDILATMRAWEQAGASQTQALRALATQYGMTVEQVRAMLGQQ